MGNLISEETLHKLEADTSFQQLSQKMQTLNIFEVLGITMPRSATVISWHGFLIPTAITEWEISFCGSLSQS